jgi:ribosomal subunit interface protein
VEVHVTLESEKYRQIAEVRIRQRRSELLAREVAPDLLEALNLALDKVEGQARRTRERKVSRKRRPARAAAARSVAAAGGGAES